MTFTVTDAAGRRFVLRRPPTGPLLPSAHDMSREHRLMHALQDSPVPVPRLVGLCQDETVNERVLPLLPDTCYRIIFVRLAAI